MKSQTLEAFETSHNPSEWQWVRVEAEKPYLSTEEAGPITKRYYGLLNIRSNRLYRAHDSSFIVALKCFVVFAATPLFIATKIATQIAYLVFYDIGYLVIAHHIYYTIRDVRQSGESISNAISEHGGQAPIDTFLRVMGRVDTIFRYIYYTPGLLIGSLGGIFIDPYLGRHHIANIEMKMNKNAKWNADGRIYLLKPESRKSLSFIKSFFFMMHDFQPQLVNGHSSYEPSYRNIQIHRFSSYDEMRNEQLGRVGTSFSSARRFAYCV